jgi:hypothetical protein
VARQNYSFEKRQKDLAKQKKRQDKLQRRVAARENRPGEQPASTVPEEGTNPPSEQELPA